ncbi:hypothetical protein Bbelb_025440 [Branchiostoma belcheri]|nr:hypothetical protein Bbelb_025440 [Branchiostoma belcheri]
MCRECMADAQLSPVAPRSCNMRSGHTPGNRFGRRAKPGGTCLSQHVKTGPGGLSGGDQGRSNGPEGGDSAVLWNAEGTARQYRRRGHPLQPKMSLVVTAFLYHQTPASKAERVGLSQSLRATPQLKKSCGDRQGAKQQVEVTTGSCSLDPAHRRPDENSRSLSDSGATEEFGVLSEGKELEKVFQKLLALLKLASKPRLAVQPIERSKSEN